MAMDIAPETGSLDSSYSDEAGRPIGEYQPSALERLNRLHREAVETARLANLLARVPVAAIVLGAGCAALLFASAGSAMGIMLGAWAFFVGTAIVALLGVTRRAAPPPLGLAQLRATSLDLNAAMLYAGFSWGAGAFIAMPASATLFSLVVFAIGSALVMIAILRVRGTSLYFLLPNIALAASAAFFGNFGLPATGFIVLLGVGLVGGIELFERFIIQRTQPPTYPLPSFS